MHTPILAQALAAERKRAHTHALIEALRAPVEPPAPKLTDFDAERAAVKQRKRDAKLVRLGARITRNPTTRQFTVRPTIDGKPVGEPFDAGRGAKWIVFGLTDRCVRLAGKLAGLTKREVSARVNAREYDITTRGVAK